MFKKPRSTQRPNHSFQGGFVPRSPTAHNPHAPGALPEAFRTDQPSVKGTGHFGPRVSHEKLRLTNITVERARTNASAMARRFTKFLTNFHGQVKIPTNLLSPDRESLSGDADGQRHLDVGQIPED
jgi:hypothetical protein